MRRTCRLKFVGKFDFKWKIRFVRFALCGLRNYWREKFDWKMLIEKCSIDDWQARISNSISDSKNVHIKTFSDDDWRMFTKRNVFTESNLLLQMSRQTSPTLQMLMLIWMVGSWARLHVGGVWRFEWNFDVGEVLTGPLLRWRGSSVVCGRGQQVLNLTSRHVVIC